MTIVSASFIPVSTSNNGDLWRPSIYLNLGNESNRMIRALRNRQPETRQKIAPDDEPKMSLECYP